MYAITVELPEGTAHETAESTAEAIRDAISGGTVTIKAEERLIDAEKLTNEHKGASVRFISDTKREVRGKLDAIIPTTSAASLVLVVDGFAHQTTLGVVTLT